MTIEFANYREVPLSPDDSTAAKWRGVPLLVNWPSKIQLDTDSIADTNRHINGMIKYAGEPRGQDVWQSPNETLQLRHGDCEDIAILKFAVLSASGMPDEDLRLVVGEIKKISGNIQHAWCAARVEGRWLALDILFDFLTPVQDYSNWQPLYTCNRAGVVKWGSVIRLSDFVS